MFPRMRKMGLRVEQGLWCRRRWQGGGDGESSSPRSRGVFPRRRWEDRGFIAKCNAVVAVTIWEMARCRRRRRSSC